MRDFIYTLFRSAWVIAWLCIVIALGAALGLAVYLWEVMG